jgi:hypothetical protein
MIICDLCKRDPVANEKNEALKRHPWGIVLTPPRESGMPEMRFCWECAIRIARRWIVENSPPPECPDTE